MLCETTTAFANFYPRPLRGGRPGVELSTPALEEISIHALCEEGDLPDIQQDGCEGAFLSTPSARRAT